MKLKDSMYFIGIHAKDKRIKIRICDECNIKHEIV